MHAPVNRRSKELFSLQCLRAIASTLVVFYHLELPPHIGAFGVDIFFVLSGFVMAKVVQEGESNTFFLLNRFARLVPLYWLLTLAICVLAYLYPELLNSTRASLTNLLRSLFFIPYFKESGKLAPMLVVGWTLNYEVLFYSLLWICLVVSRKNFIFLAAILFVSMYLSAPNFDSAVTKSFLGDQSIFEFILGLLVYKAYDSLKATSPLVFTMLVPLSLVALGCSEYADLSGQPLGRLLYFGIPASILVYSSVALESHLGALGWLKDHLVAAGNASYATYLSHFYVIEGFRKVILKKPFVELTHPWLAGLIVVFCSLVVGHFLYLFVDRPLSKKLKYSLHAACKSLSIRLKARAA